MAAIKKELFEQLKQAAIEEGYSEEELVGTLVKRGHSIEGLGESAQTPPNGPEQASGPSFGQVLGQAAGQAQKSFESVMPWAQGAADVMAIGGKEANSQIQDRVVKPLVQKGHVKTGGVIGTASEMMLPKTREEAYLAGAGMAPEAGAIVPAATKWIGKNVPGMGADVAKTLAYMTPGGRIPFEQKQAVQSALKNIGETYKKFMSVAFPRDVKVGEVTGAKGYGRANSVIGDVAQGSVKHNMKESRAFVRSAYEDVGTVAQSLPATEASNTLVAKADIASDLDIYGKGAGDPAVMTTVKDLESLYILDGEVWIPRKVSPKKLVDLLQKLKAHAFEPSSKSATGELNRRGTLFLKLSNAVKEDLKSLKSPDLDNSMGIASQMADEHFTRFGSDTAQKLLDGDKKDALSTIFKSRTTANEARAAMNPKAFEYAANKRADELLTAIQKSDDPISAFNQATGNDAEEAISILGQERYLRLQRIADLEAKTKAAEKALEDAGKRVIPLRRGGDRPTNYKLSDMRKTDASMWDKLTGRIGQAAVGGGSLAVAYWTGHPAIVAVGVAAGLGPEVMARVYLSAKGTQFRGLVHKAAMAVGTDLEKVAVRNLVNSIPKADRPKKNLSNLTTKPKPMSAKSPVQEETVEVIHADTGKTKRVSLSEAQRLIDTGDWSGNEEAVE